MMFTGLQSSESLHNKKSEEWTNKFRQLLKTAHDALSVLYDGLETDLDNVVDVKKGGNLLLQGEETVAGVAGVFMEQVQMMVVLISEPTNGPVCLPLGSVLRLVSRSLGVTFSDVRSMPSLSELAGLLPAVHRSALNLLSHLILSCRTMLLPRSRVLVDLCLQSLASTRHLDDPEKSKTRACAYQALILEVQLFGWGQHLTCHSKTITQEIITDIREHSLSKQITAVAETHSRQEIPMDGKRKGKNKKKKKAESYSDLAVTNSTVGQNVEDNVSLSFEATHGALKLSRLMLEKAEFPYAENLMRSVLEITQNFQREPAAVSSPYSQAECRSAMYRAVSACASVRLNHGCSRNDAVKHFQMTSLALSLLNDGLDRDSSYEVQMVIMEKLNNLQAMVNMNRPVIRRVLLDESTTTKDMTEVERDLDNVIGENTHLQKQVLDVEVECQSLKRLVSSLRQEIETLRANNNRNAAATSSCTDQKVYLTDPEDFCKVIDSDSFDSLGGGFGKDDEDRTEELSENKGSETERDTVVTVGELSDEGAGTSRDTSQDDNSEVSHSDKSMKRKSSSSEIAAGRKRKKSLKSGHVAAGEKKSKPDSNIATANDSQDDDSVQAMISDFVDAGPDLV